MTDTQAFKDHITENFRERMAGDSAIFCLDLELTSRCENGCPYCGAFAGGGVHDIDYERLQRFLKTAGDHLPQSCTNLLVTLCGGDPLLYPLFGNLVMLLHRLDIPFLVKGNASTITADKADFLQRHGCAAVKMTLFGNKKTHNLNRGKDTLDVLTSKTKLLQSCGIPVIWHLSICPENLDETLDMLPFIREQKPDGVTIGRLARIGRMDQNVAYSDFTPDTYRKFLLAVLDFYRRHYKDGFNLQFREKLWVPLLVEEGLLEQPPEGSERLVCGCDAYGPGFTVSNREEILLCGLMPTHTIGTLTELTDNPERMATHATLDPTQPATCHDCRFTPVCRGCRAIALAHSGNLYDKDPQCWVKTLQ
jgi:radical SAM protein with 4Fe4S-binding SPASM domain